MIYPSRWVEHDDGQRSLAIGHVEPRPEVDSEPFEVVLAADLWGAVEALKLVQRLVNVPLEAILDDAERVRRIKLVVDTALPPS
jgi:hypothetical protein